MDLNYSYDTKFENFKLMQPTDRRAELMLRYPNGPYKSNLYYPLPRKSGSTILSFPAQMCNLSNSDQKECMGIALQQGNKDTERNFTF